MSVIVGVDAGGSTTRALAEVDGKERTIVQDEPANVRTIGVEAAARTMARAIVRALDGATPGAIHIGIAGGGRRGTAALLADALRSHFPTARIEVSTDAQIALRAGVPEGDGIVLISGTGSICYGEIGGRSYRAGGFGLAIGDEGSGAAIGAAALNLALRARDGRGPREPLFDAVEAQLGATDPQTMLDSVYGDPDPNRILASLAPLVIESATAGERTATRIVQGAALELHDLVKAVVRNANAAQLELPLVLAGGMFAQNSLLSFLLETRIANDFPLLSLIKNSPQPVYGALALARASLVAP